jgi:hypothetical protein
MQQHTYLRTVSSTLTQRLRESERLSNAGNRWLALHSPGAPRFTVHHRDWLAEIAFLKSYIAWELFLEESFVLYLMGKTAPRGGRPYRTIVPSTRKVAEKLFIPEKKKFADWTVTDFIVERALKSFRRGTDPYSAPLARYNNMLNEIRSIRNAIAHSSLASQERFKQIARDRLALGIYPPGLTVGGFLSTTVPASHPPESFFENYLSTIRLAAGDIIPV